MKNALVVLMAVILLIPAFAQAQPKGGIELKSVAEVEVAQLNEKGDKEVKRVEADKANVLPGDTVIFTLTYVNNGDETAADVAVTNPVPEHMVYLDDSAEGAGTRIDFSLNNGKTYAPADRLTLKNAAGMERPARAADFTNVRWTLVKPLEKGGKGTVSFRAKVK